MTSGTLGVALLLSILATPLAGEAQQAGKVPRLGLLGLFTPELGACSVAAVHDGPGGSGWQEGQNMAFEPDQYGGYTSLPVSGGATGRFRVAKLGNRWVWVTPEGNAFWLRGVYGVDKGGVYETNVIAKYGDADLRWAPQQVRRLLAWGFNGLAEYANGYATPWAAIRDPRWPTGTQPVKIPAVPFPLQAASYSKRNLFGYAAQPVKDLYAALDSHFRGYRGQFPDVFDPNFARWIAGRVASSEYAIVTASPYLLGLSSDDTDYLTGFGPGPDFVTTPPGKTHPHLGFVTLIGSPTQATNPFLGGAPYTDTKVYTKYALRDFLQAKYGTIGALNTAWGSTYTTFDSAGGWRAGTGLLRRRHRR